MPLSLIFLRPRNTTPMRRAGRKPSALQTEAQWVQTPAFTTFNPAYVAGLAFLGHRGVNSVGHNCRNHLI